MKISDKQSFKPATNSVPILGYVDREDDDQVWLKDRVGTWIIAKEDIVSRAQWDGVDSRFGGEPAKLFVRDGAEILEVRPTKIDLSLRPLVLPEDLPESVGLEALRCRAAELGRRLGFSASDADDACSSGTTYCQRDICIQTPWGPSCYPGPSYPCDSTCD